MVGIFLSLVLYVIGFLIFVVCIDTDDIYNDSIITVPMLICWPLAIIMLINRKIKHKGVIKRELVEDILKEI